MNSWIEDPIQAGLALSIIAGLTPVVLILVHPFIRKVTNCWIFWIIFSGFFLIWLFVIKYYQDWTRLYDWFTGPGSIVSHIGDPEWDIFMSRGLLLDFCPFCAIFMLIGTIVDPRRKIVTGAAPIALFGGLLSIIGTVGVGDYGDARFTADYVFFGNELNEGFFLFHYTMILTGTLVMLNTPSGKLKAYAFTGATFSVYVAYVLAVSNLLRVNKYCTGAVPYDWSPEGEYYDFYRVLKVDFPYCAIGALVICAAIVGAIITLWIVVQNFAWWKIKDKKRKGWLLKGTYILLNKNKDYDFELEEEDEE